MTDLELQRPSNLSMVASSSTENQLQSDVHTATGAPSYGLRPSSKKRGHEEDFDRSGRLANSKKQRTVQDAAAEQLMGKPKKKKKKEKKRQRPYGLVRRWCWNVFPANACFFYFFTYRLYNKSNDKRNSHGDSPELPHCVPESRFGLFPTAKRRR